MNGHGGCERDHPCRRSARRAADRHAAPAEKTHVSKMREVRRTLEQSEQLREKTPTTSHTTTVDETLKGSVYAGRSDWARGGYESVWICGRGSCNSADPFGLCPKNAGGDGKTETFTDCMDGTSGYYAQQAASGHGGLVNNILGAGASCGESGICESLAGVLSAIGGIGIVRSLLATGAGDAALGTGEVKLLREFFGQGLRGAISRAENFEIPEGLTSKTLNKYAGIARDAIGRGIDKTGVQAARLELIKRALDKLIK